MTNTEVRIEETYQAVELGDRHGIPADPQPHVPGLDCWCGAYMSPPLNIKSVDGIHMIYHRNSPERAERTLAADIGAWVRSGGTLD